MYVLIKCENPMFLHDCKKCKFVGRVQEHGGEAIGDVYFCNNTVVFRLGVDGWDYVSFEFSECWRFIREIPRTSVEKIAKLLFEEKVLVVRQGVVEPTNISTTPLSA